MGRMARPGTQEALGMKANLGKDLALLLVALLASGQDGVWAQ